MNMQEQMKRLNCSHERIIQLIEHPVVHYLEDTKKFYYRLAIFKEGEEILNVDSDDPMKWLIKCPYCGHITEIGDTYMISGYVGCDHCYFVPYGLRDTVMNLRENDYDEYVKGDFYKKGFIL